MRKMIILIAFITLGVMSCQPDPELEVQDVSEEVALLQDSGYEVLNIVNEVEDVITVFNVSIDGDKLQVAVVNHEGRLVIAERNGGPKSFKASCPGVCYTHCEPGGDAPCTSSGCPDTPPGGWQTCTTWSMSGELLSVDVR